MASVFNKNKNKKKSAAEILVSVIVALSVAASFAGVFLVYSNYLGEQLYIESVTQLTETSNQSFEKLDVRLEEQWRYVTNLDLGHEGKTEMTCAELADYLALAQKTISPADEDLELFAIDSRGYYYTTEGEQGAWQYYERLNEAIRYSEKKSIVVSDKLNKLNSIAFVLSVKNPLSVGESSVAYFALQRTVENIAPYFGSTAYNEKNKTYVLSDDGIKLFEDENEGLGFDGDNLYNSMREKVKFGRLKDFDEFLRSVGEDDMGCTDVTVNGANYYLVLKKYESYEWAVMNFVPSGEVAATTRVLIYAMIRLFLVIAAIFTAVVAIAVFVLMKYRQNRIAFDVKAKSAEELEAANELLKKSQLEATEALKREQKANGAKSEFLANVSHDIRTPMNAVVNMARLIKLNLDSPQKINEYTDKIIYSSEILLGMLNDVLDMGKIESGKTNLTIEKVDLPELIKKVCAIIEPQAAAKKQNFYVRITNLEEKVVFADRVRLSRILLNILYNALKYTNEGGKIDFETIGLGVRSGESGLIEKVCFTVSDNGIGIPDDFLPKIFEPFARVENSVTNKTQGTGLGMAITKSLVELMGGDIKIESELGKGSVFKVFIEFAAVCENAAQEHAHEHAPEHAEPENLQERVAPEHAKPEKPCEIAVYEAATEILPEKAAEICEKSDTENSVIKGMNFLCAEDNLINAEVLEALLSAEGATCEIYADGKSVVEAFVNSDSDKFDAVLMDVQMPVMNGYEATEEIRSSLHPRALSIPVIAMTANAFSSDVKAALSSGMNAHLSKPVDMHKLKHVISKLRVNAKVKTYK